MQLVEVRERVEEVVVIPPPKTATAQPTLFDGYDADDLLAFGVPEDWLDDERHATEDRLFDLLEHLPQEAQEALLNLAVGEAPTAPEPVPANADPFGHPDAGRRFRVLDNAEELERALAFPWEKWAVFLHPDQRRYVERRYNGPARISGSAGTGKAIVALHRTVHLARSNANARILLTTFSKALANALKLKLDHLAGIEPAIVDRITVQPISGVGYDLYAKWFGQPNIASATQVQTLLAQAADAGEGERF